MIGGVPRLSTPMPELPEAWELGESLGIGSFGSVWLAAEKQSGKVVAIKVLPLESKRRARARSTSIITIL